MLVPTGITGLMLAPATPAMVGVEVELVNLPNREQRLRLALAGLDTPFQYIVFDCPPSLGMITLNALTAADSVLVPLQAEYYAMEGLGELVRTIAAVRRSTNPASFARASCSRCTTRAPTSAAMWSRKPAPFFGSEVFQAVVPRSVRLAEAPSHGKCIFQYEPSGKGARAYADLAGEVHARALAAGGHATAVG